MPLDNVSRKTKSGWIKTNPEDAWIRYKNGVSANDRLFRCNICGQYVTFVVGREVANHFRHNSAEADKECAEREKLYNYYNSRSNSNNNNPKIQKYIFPNKLSINDLQKFIMLKEEIKGIPATGCLFKEKNGDKLTIYENAYLNYGYLLLIGRKVNPKNNSFYSDIKIEELGYTVCLRNKWYLYRVWADIFTESNYNFFKSFYTVLKKEPSIGNPKKLESIKVNNQKNLAHSYKELIIKLNKCKGKTICIDHSFANIIKFFNHDAFIKNWLMKTVKKGLIKEDALKIIKSFCINNNN